MRLNLHSEAHKTIAGTYDCPKVFRVNAADMNGGEPPDPGQLRQSFCVRTIGLVKLG
jgi:hypothetical protein